MRDSNKWLGRTPATKGQKVPQLVSAPEWAYCTVSRFEELLRMAEREQTTLEKMQGGWDYPADNEEEGEDEWQS